MVRVMRLIVAVFAVAFLVGACGLVGAADPWKSYRAICQINVKDGRSAWQGSGTLIATSGDLGLVLSCRHVNTRVGMNVELQWIGANNQRTRATVVRIGPGRGFDTDLAVLVCQRPRGVNPVPVAKFDPSHGPWISAGYRGGRFLISTATRAEWTGDLIKVNAAYVGGMSGGCVFDSRGRLVGVVVASDFKNLGYAADGPLMHSMLDAYRR